MPRLQLHAKLLLAFGIVLLPIPALLCADFFSDKWSILLSAFMAALLARFYVRPVRRQAEVDALRAEAERHANQLDAIIASVPDAIFLATPDGKLLDANPAGRRLLGLEGCLVQGLSLADCLHRYDFRHTDGRTMQLAELPLQRTLDGESFTDVELSLRAQSGEERLLSINGAPVRNSSGQIILGQIVAHDITDRKQVEQERTRLLERELALSRVSQALVMEVELDRVAHVAIEQTLHASRCRRAVAGEA
jgi:PAS domain S-box-containing protein